MGLVDIRAELHSKLYLYDLNGEAYRKFYGSYRFMVEEGRVDRNMYSILCGIIGNRQRHYRNVCEELITNQIDKELTNVF